MPVIYRSDMVKMLVPNNVRIIDIGADYGRLFGSKATNVDIRSHDRIKKTFAKSSNREMSVPNFIQADAACLPFKDHTYDYAILSEILEHVDDPVKVVNEAQRVAYVVVICVPNEYQWAKKNKPFGPQSGHKRFYTEESLWKLTENTGLQVIEFIKITYPGWSFFIISAGSKVL